MIYWLIADIINAYILSALAFLCLSLFDKYFKSNIGRLLNVANMLLLVALFPNLILEIFNTFECRFGQAANLQTSKSLTHDIYSVHSCYSFLIWTLILGFSFHLAFFKKPFRTNKWATMVSIISLSVLMNLEKIAIVITDFYRDYVPSSWSVYYANDEEWLKTAIFLAYFFICCWLSRLKPKALIK